MRFTYSDYERFLNIIDELGYIKCGYQDYQEHEKCVILRHDVDYILDKAYKFADLEYKNNSRSTYFILLSTDFYNIASKENTKAIRKMGDQGHEIGLHFDDSKYNLRLHDLQFYIREELDIMSKLLGIPIKSISMHNPSQRLLDADVKIPGVTNAYSNLFFKDFKYISDSSRHWRENPEDAINSGEYNRLQILTHPFWYSEYEKSYNESIVDFINGAKKERYNLIKNGGLKNIDEIIREKDIL